MQPFITAYGLDFPRFREIIQTSNSLVAGSAALYCYLQQKELEPGFTPGDLDIWMEDTHSIFMESGHFNQRSNAARISQFLFQQGYNISPVAESNEYGDLQQIKQVLSFINSTGKKIQVILVTATKLLPYIAKHFDLSHCITWWDPVLNLCDTMYPETTLEREMFVIPRDDPWPDKLYERVDKYTNRGFTLRETFFVCEKDSRTMLDDESCVLKGVTAFDMWTLDDVNAIEFLKASSYHILLKAGNQFHAFHRKNLCTFMATRSLHLPSIGEVYDTPHNQTIIKDAFIVLPYTDYSIYELLPEFTVSHHTKQKSMYTMKCYTVEGWNNGVMSAFFPPVTHGVSEEPSDLVRSLEFFRQNMSNDLYHAENYFMRQEDFYAREQLLADILDNLE